MPVSSQLSVLESPCWLSVPEKNASEGVGFNKKVMTSLTFLVVERIFTVIRHIYLLSVCRTAML